MNCVHNRSIRLLVLDFDNCATNTLDVWGRTLSQGVEYLCANRKIDREALHDMIREAHGQFRFNDFPKLLDWMNENQTIMRHPADRDLARSIDDAAKASWYEQTRRHTKFYDGFLQTVLDVKQKGARIVFQTDCEEAPFIRRLYLCAENAVQDGFLPSPNQILDTIDHIYCQPGIVPDDPILKDHVPHSFVQAVQTKVTLWRDNLYKPSHIHMSKIMQDAGVSGDETLYAGDSHKDGCEAKSVDPQAQFAWCRYGAHVQDWVLDFYSKVGSRSYSYGEPTIRKLFQEKAILPDLVLENGLQDILDHYEFAPIHSAQPIQARQKTPIPQL